MADRYYKIRIQFPGGTIERESGWPDPGPAARIAVVSTYMDHLLDDPAKMIGAGYQRIDAEDLARLPKGWGRMSEDERYAIATQAGYKAVAVAWYENRVLVWHDMWPEERP